mgnify:FL=1
MKKKEIKISNEEMMELMGLKRTSNSDDDSDKTAIDLAIEKYSKEELAAKETEQPDEPTTDEDTPSDSEESTKVVEIKGLPPTPTIQRRVSSKLRKLSLEEYRSTYLKVPIIKDRKPVFVSCEVRDRLEDYVRKLGGRKMSVSGLLENIARQHLDTYDADFEQWRKL